ncbi:HNH endonuclease [Lactobacillus hominis]|uniref:HNH endonuclease n=1 Tax=Lactobacillus hominis TaxID=1203033 RepID=UPI00058FEBDA|nr:HNH endonuclease [Lactobacillus hominis]MCT3348933.1 HNH endonuclease [Lactobacillus hominis]
MTERKYKTNNNEFYHSKEWRRLRKQALDRDHRLCQVCLRKGKLTFATTVHHIKPIRAFKGQKLELDNLLTVCPACHNSLHREKPMDLRKKNRQLKNYTNSVKTFRPNPDNF